MSIWSDLGGPPKYYLSENSKLQSREQYRVPRLWEGATSYEVGSHTLLFASLTPPPGRLKHSSLSGKIGTPELLPPPALYSP